MSAWQDVRCPRCDKLLFKAWGIGAHVLLRVVCRCGRIIQIREGFLAEVLGDSTAHSALS